MEDKNTHIVYGAGTGIALVLYALILHITRQDLNKALAWLAYLPFFAGLLLNAFAYSKANEGYITFGKVFFSCFKATMIITLIMLAWTIITIYAFPGMKERAMEMTRSELMKNPAITDDQIDMSMRMMQKWYTTFLISGVVFGELIVGAILSLIAAAIPPKKGERPFADNF